MAGSGMAVSSRAAQLGWAISSSAMALVWGVNGLWCKVLGGVPRHEAIVGEVLADVVDVFGNVVAIGDVDVDVVAAVLTRVIGVLELLMLAWFLSGHWPRLNAASQITIVLAMNIIEQLVAPELLLFGPWNFLWACCFCAVVVVRTRLHLARLAQRSDSAVRS